MQWGLSTLDRVAEHLVLPLVENAVCTAPETVSTVLAPLGLGFMFNLGGACEGVFEMIDSAREAISGQAEDNADWMAEDLGINDCNSGIHSFAKIMCDLACITDAVRAGNAAIITRLEEVFSVLQKNVLLMMNYHATNTEGLIKWLADLTNWHGANLAQKISALKAPILIQQINACNRTVPHNARGALLPSSSQPATVTPGASASDGRNTWDFVDCVMAALSEGGPRGRASSNSSETVLAGGAGDQWSAAVDATYELRGLISPSLRRRLDRTATPEARRLLAKAEAAATQAVASVKQKASSLHKSAERIQKNLKSVEGEEVAGGRQEQEKSLASLDRLGTEVLAEAAGAHADFSAHVQREVAAVRSLLPLSASEDGGVLGAAAGAPETSNQFGEVLSAVSKSEALKLLDLVAQSHERSEGLFGA